jgi:hypothetical protein
LNDNDKSSTKSRGVIDKVEFTSDTKGDYMIAVFGYQYSTFELSVKGEFD